MCPFLFFIVAIMEEEDNTLDTVAGCKLHQNKFLSDKCCRLGLRYFPVGSFGFMNSFY